MGTAERRLEILKYLCRVRKATMPELAEKFGVSIRTIQGILSAGASVYFNQLYVQSKKKD